MSAVLELSDVRKTFGNTEIIRGVDLEVTEGQAIVNGETIRGRTYNPDRDGEPGVTVQATHLQTGQVRMTTSDDSGVYEFGNSLPGLYRLVASKEGYSPSRMRSIGVRIHRGEQPRRARRVRERRASLTLRELAGPPASR